ncbi:MAG: hypothetical protein DRP06_03915 [Candidatus Aenigmatarchaeota archaeon]|nr:MAG: hypothetical protein DRP06_03915 [Candidatus Aenigmarchaeota archaeon]
MKSLYKSKASISEIANLIFFGTKTIIINPATNKIKASIYCFNAKNNTNKRYPEIGKTTFSISLNWFFLIIFSVSSGHSVFPNLIMLE